MVMILVSYRGVRNNLFKTLCRQNSTKLSTYVKSKVDLERSPYSLGADAPEFFRKWDQNGKKRIKI